MNEKGKVISHTSDFQTPPDNLFKKNYQWHKTRVLQLIIAHTNKNGDKLNVW